MHQISFAETLWQDTRYGLRALLKNKAFTSVAVMTLALGIGANTAIFSVLYAVLLRPLPYVQTQELVWAADSFPRMHTAFVPHPSYFAWRDKNQVFSGVAAYDSAQDYNLSGGGDPERVSVIPVSASFFPLLGVVPELGRSFLATEEVARGVPSVILSHSLWADRFGAQTTLSGQSITLNETSYTVVGVLPPGFRFPNPAMKADVFVPLGLPPQLGPDGSIHRLSVIARLKPGVTPTQAASNLSVIEPGMLAQYPKWFSRYSQETRIEVVPLHDKLAGNVRLPLVALLIAVAAVLLIGCANVANLQLVRATSRQREMAVRIVLGADKRRLVRQLLTESGLLALLGGSAGVLLALLGMNLLRIYVPKSILVLGLQEVRMDSSILIFALAITVLSGILAGLAPGMAASKPDLNHAMKEGETRTGMGRSRNLFRNLLMSGEIFAAIVLLTAAGLLLKSFLRLSAVDMGFSPRNVLTAQIALSQRGYPEISRQAAFFQQTLERAAALPGVQYAAVTDRLPPDGQASGRRIAIVGRPAPEANDVAYSVVEVAISPEYFPMMGIPIISGRNFAGQDRADGLNVAIVNQAFVRRFFPNGEDPLQQGILAAGTSAPLSIVGMVGDARNVGLAEPVVPAIFRPFAQRPNSRMYVILQTASDPSAFVPLLREQVLAVDKGQPLYAAATMQQVLDEDTAPPRFYMGMSGLLAGLALLLAAVGIYGVVSYAVTQRTHEIGLRMALGAQRADALWLVLGQGMPWVVGGILVGICGAMAVTRFLRSLLFNVKPTDPWTFVAASVLLIGVALAAFYLPVRRAMRVDPMIALRHE